MTPSGSDEWAVRLLLRDELPLGKDRANDVGDAFRGRIGQLRVHRQRQDLSCDALCYGEIARGVTEVPVRRLEMDGHGVVDAALDVGLRQSRAQRIPHRGA